MNTSWKIPSAIIAAGLVIAGAVYVVVSREQGVGGGNPALVRPVGAQDHILGNPAAKVFIVEYSDFDCEFCKSYHDTLHHIIANQGTKGEVAWVFRQFPLTELHDNALLHAKATECIAEVAGNDAFWKFADALFARQPVNPADYGTIASIAGISGPAFATCYASESASKPLVERVNADRQNALDIGARGTPYSVILTTGQPPVVLDGAYSYDAVKQIVDEALKNQ